MIFALYVAAVSVTAVVVMVFVCIQIGKRVSKLKKERDALQQKQK